MEQHNRLQVFQPVSWSPSLPLTQSTFCFASRDSFQSKIKSDHAYAQYGFYWTTAFNNKNKLSSVQLLSRVPTLCDPMDCSTPDCTSLSITNSQSLLKLMSIESVMPSNHLILCCPLLFLPSIFPSIRVFSNESASHIRWPKYRSFSISPSNEYSGLISLRTDWLDLLAVQGTLKSLLQHPSSKASILRHSAFLFQLKFRALFIFSLTYTFKAFSVISNILFSELAIQVFMKFHAQFNLTFLESSPEHTSLPNLCLLANFYSSFLTKLLYQSINPDSAMHSSHYYRNGHNLCYRNEWTCLGHHAYKERVCLARGIILRARSSQHKVASI